MGWGKCVIWAGLALTASIALPGVASAEWSVTASVGETIEANDNPQVDQIRRRRQFGGVVGSTTNLSLQAVHEWPTVSWTIGTSLGFSKFWGPGAQDSLDGVNVGALTTSLRKDDSAYRLHCVILREVLPASADRSSR